MKSNEVKDYWYIYYERSTDSLSDMFKKVKELEDKGYELKEESTDNTSEFYSFRDARDSEALLQLVRY